MKRKMLQKTAQIPTPNLYVQMVGSQNFHVHVDVQSRADSFFSAPTLGLAPTLGK